MTTVDIIIWSLALGAIGVVPLGRLVDLAIHPCISTAHSTASQLAVFALVAVLSGLAGVLDPDPDPEALEAAQVIAGPLWVGLSAFWLGRWLQASQRERLMARALRLAALVTLLSALACFALPAHSGSRRRVPCRCWPRRSRSG